MSYIWCIRNKWSYNRNCRNNNPRGEVEIAIETVPKYLLKTGIKLPKNEQANHFLRNNLHGDLEKSDVNTEIINFQSIIYEIFANSY